MESIRELLKYSGFLGGSGGSLSDAEALELLIELDLLPAVTNSAGAILTDSDSNIILRY